MLILFVIVFSLLIFPIFINIGFAIRKTNNIFRIYFYLNIFGLINILSGFAETKKEGIFIHYKNDKAKLIKYYKLLNFKSNMMPFKGFKIPKFELNFDVGNQNNTALPIIFAGVSDFIGRNFYYYLKRYRPHVRFINNINIYEYKTVFNIGSMISVNFNLLTVLLNLIIMLAEKIIK